MSIRHTANHHAFDNAESSPEASYWVGFMLCDGTILDRNSGSCQVRLAISSKDKHHLEKFRHFLESDHTIYVEKRSSKQLFSYTGHGNGEKEYERVVLTVNSNRLALALARYGVLPRKSKNAEVRFLENNRDFWRGAIDGDGTIHIRKDGLPMIRLIGSAQLIQQFIAFTKNHTGQKTINPISARSIWQASVHGRNAVKLIQILYLGNAVALDRKMELAKKAMQWTEKPRPHGERHHNTTLTDTQVKEIKERLEKHHWIKYLAEEYKVSQKTIYNIKNGKVWTHI